MGEIQWGLYETLVSENGIRVMPNNLTKACGRVWLGGGFCIGAEKGPWGQRSRFQKVGEAMVFNRLKMVETHHRMSQPRCGREAWRASGTVPRDGARGP